MKLSEFESYMTGDREKTWNKFLAQAAIMFTALTIVFIIICQSIIRWFYKLNKSVVKQRYKSIASFKILSISFCLFITISIYTGIIFITNEKEFRFLADPVPFIISLVGNIILLVFLTTNKDAWKYLVIKKNSFIEQRQFEMERRKLRRKHPRNKVMPVVHPDRAQDDGDGVYVIDMENTV